MGNLVSEFYLLFCHLCCQPFRGGHQPVVFSGLLWSSLSSVVIPHWPGPPHFSCTCQGPWSHRLSHWNHIPVSSSFYIALRSRCPLLQTMYLTVGIFPLVNWKDLPKKPILYAQNSRMFGPSRVVCILPPEHRFSLLLSPPEQGVMAGKYHPVPLHFLVQRSWR